jgi:hypothetical protein
MRKTLCLNILLFLVTAVSFTAFNSVAATPGSAQLDKCLNNPTNQIKDCLKAASPHQSINQCFNLSETIYSAHSKEAVKNHCFYSISEFPTLNTCLASAKKFFIAENKDHGLFECFRQFSSQISENSCLKIAKMMTYSEKRNYLANHCRNL